MNNEVAVAPQRDLFSILGPRMGGRARRAVETFMIVELVWKTGKTIYTNRQTRRIFRISVDSTDDLYPDMHRWILEQLPSERRKSVFVKSGRSNNGNAIAIDGGDARPVAAKLAMFYDGTVRQTVELKGFQVDVWVESDSGTSTPSETMRSWKPDQIRFEVKSAEGRDAVIAWIDEIAAVKVSDPEPRLYTPRWESWYRQTDIPARPLSSVVLAEDVAERLVSDLRQFLADEVAYARIGLPWHRGYLLHGEAGTGKTTIARALASQFGLDLYFLPLSDIRTDSALMNLVQAVPARSVLLMEDIDVVHGAKSRDDAESEGVTLSGLLNALDGVITPHGLITILTTNDRSVLDPALVRPGRADVEQEIGFLTNDQAQQLLVALTGVDLIDMPKVDVEGKNVSPAEVVGIIKAHISDPETAIHAVSQRYGVIWK